MILYLCVKKEKPNRHKVVRFRPKAPQIVGLGLHAGVAQLAEQLICNQQVVGSSPIAGSKI